MNYAQDRYGGPPAGRGYRLPEDGPLPDLSLYDRLTDDGIAAADRQGQRVGPNVLAADTGSC